MDSNNKVHISYLTLHADLKYATNVPGSWVTTTIDTLGGYHNSIAIDGNNKVYISYRASGLKYATNVSGSWTTATLDGSIIADWTSLAVDSSNKVHISYYDYTFGDLKYATNQ